MEDTKNAVYVTKKLCTTNKSVTIYLPNFVGLEVGDVVRLTCYEYGNPAHKSMVIKRVCKLGGSAIGCYLDKTLGFKKGDIVVARAEYIGKVKADSDDTGITVEKAFEKDFD